MAKGGVPEPIDLAQESERARVLQILQMIQEAPGDDAALYAILRRYPHARGTYAKSQLLGAYHQLVQAGDFVSDLQLEQRLRGRPVRTISGVAPVAVLTEPYPCPGTCIFCPEQKEAPKSYLDGEPGVLRAIQNNYDPYEQTAARLNALAAIGHATDKVELLVLGGTWSYYPEAYRRHFLRRCFEVLNEAPAETLEEALLVNETAPHRNVGLVVETRPDWITPDEVVRLRREGVTKVQLGVQSVNESILVLNQRGHTVQDVYRALQWLRLGGFKIVLHWMPNLFGATPESDLADFRQLWEDPGLRPDEIKIYPTALLEGTRLYDLWQQGKYQPYPEDVLLELLVACKQYVPPYCRINRLMRDIPAQYIVAGTTKSNLRQIVQQQMAQQHLTCQCIRCREIRGKESVSPDAIALDVIAYHTSATQEYFLQYITPQNNLAGFLRLSLPTTLRDAIPLPEIRHAAMIRELHVYGPAMELGQRGWGGQHRGLGRGLLERAADIARAHGFRELAVIAAAGTRDYYRERGFSEGALYLIQSLITN